MGRGRGESRNREDERAYELLEGTTTTMASSKVAWMASESDRGSRDECPE